MHRLFAAEALQTQSNLEQWQVVLQLCCGKSQHWSSKKGAPLAQDALKAKIR